MDGQFDYDGDGISDVKEWEGVSIFEYIPDSFTWDQADNDAKLRGGLLATISNKSENDHLLKISKKKKGWIGGHDSGFENSWNWVSGEPFKYQNWKKISQIMRVTTKTIWKFKAMVNGMTFQEAMSKDTTLKKGSGLIQTWPTQMVTAIMNEQE